MADMFDPPLDPGIAAFVVALRAERVETFESCEGGEGHAYAEPTIRFHGDIAEGFRALSAATRCRLPVADLRRVWPVIDGEPTGPHWEMTFSRRAPKRAGTVSEAEARARGVPLHRRPRATPAPPPKQGSAVFAFDEQSLMTEADARAQGLKVWVIRKRPRA